MIPIAAIAVLLLQAPKAPPPSAQPPVNAPPQLFEAPRMRPSRYDGARKNLANEVDPQPTQPDPTTAPAEAPAPPPAPAAPPGAAPAADAGSPDAAAAAAIRTAPSAVAPDANIATPPAPPKMSAAGNARATLNAVGAGLAPFAPLTMLLGPGIGLLWLASRKVTSAGAE